MTLGLYIHIPFCAKICHYCDFAKSARYDGELVSSYFDKLNQHLKAVKTLLRPEFPELVSVYFGGGTPSLFTDELARLIDGTSDWLTSQSEVTIEVNPEHAEPDALKFWRRAGVNRVSLGIQSFDAGGLSVLTRTHSEKRGRDAILKSLAEFTNVNADLIFGWPGQTAASWERDLAICQELKVPHISLYSLSFEGNTVFARRNERGLMAAMPEELEERLYRIAQVNLSRTHHQEEVSNFAQMGAAAVHNNLYWTNAPYIGLGIGAHGYLKLPEFEPIGLRYSYSNQWKRFMAGQSLSDSLDGFLSASHAAVETRSLNDWLLERVWTGLRTPAGLDIKGVFMTTGIKFWPTPVVQEGLARGSLDLTDGILRLNPVEWFRESAWTQEVSRSFPADEALI